MRNFLFLLDELPPTDSANGICVDKIMDELLLMGHSVSCVCWGEQVKSGVKVYKIPKKPFDCVVAKLRKKNDIFSSVLIFVLRIFNRFSHIVFLPWWPMESPTTVRRFYKKACEAIDVDAVTDVIAVSYPGETLVAMKRIKQRYCNRVSTIMYPLDVTLFGTNKGTSIEKCASKILNKRFMVRCALFADKLLVLENAYEQFNRTFPSFMHSKFKVAGIPLLIPRRTGSEQGFLEREEIHFAFAGTLISTLRSPAVLFELLDELAGCVNKKIFFDLYGKCDKQIEQIVASRKFEFEFTNHGWVTESELDVALSKADAFVNIGNNSALIPSKLFVYLSYKKPILHICSTVEDACLFYLSQCQNCFVLYNNHDEIKNSATEILGLITNSTSLETDVGELFKSCTPRFTANILLE